MTDGQTDATYLSILLTETVTKFLNVLESLNILVFNRKISTPGSLPWPGCTRVGKGLPLMYKLSWIRLITHDIYTLVHSPPPLITYCHSTGLATPGGLARISKQQVFPILSSWLPLSALILHRGCQYEQGINEFDHLTSEKLHQGPQGPHSVPTWEAGCLIDEIIIRLNRSDSLV